MSGLSKISNTIIAVFVLSFMVFSGVTFFQIQQNIAEETEAALAQAKAMVKVGVVPDDIEHVLVESPHVSVERFFGRLSFQQTQDLHQADHYASGLQQLSLNQLTPLVIPISENQYLVVTPNEHPELIQNLNFFWLVAALFLVTLALLLYMIKTAMQHQLKPLKQVATALDALSRGQHADHLDTADLEEVNQVVNRFKHLQSALKNKQQLLTQTDKKLAMLQEEERKYLARELHDNVGQLLTTIKAHAYILTHATEKKVIVCSAHKVQAFCQQISDAIRQLTAHLHPLTLDKVTLQESLERLIYDQEQAHKNVQWQVSINLKNYTAEQERDVHVYRFVQEALNNAIKHADASRIIVDVYGDTKTLSVNIVDNGSGFSEHAQESVGMSSLRSRARCIGAECVISSSDRGVHVQLHGEMMLLPDAAPPEAA